MTLNLQEKLLSCLLLCLEVVFFPEKSQPYLGQINRGEAKTIIVVVLFWLR